MDRILQYLSDYGLGLSYGDLPEEVVDRAKPRDSRQLQHGFRCLFGPLLHFGAGPGF